MDREMEDNTQDFKNERSKTKDIDSTGNEERK